MSSMADGKMMSAFLQEIARSSACSSVSLGRLPGFPASTDDPAIVDKAVAALEARVDEMDVGVKQLKMRQRIRDLKWGADCLRENGGDTPAQKWWVKRGAAWCEENEIEYGTLREMGVSPELLKRAGVAR